MHDVNNDHEQVSYLLQLHNAFLSNTTEQGPKEPLAALTTQQQEVHDFTKSSWSNQPVWYYSNAFSQEEYFYC